MTIKAGVVQQSNFSDYAVLRMNEMPDIRIELLPSAAGQQFSAGQIAALPQAPMAPAIANAVYRLKGARLRAMPILPTQVKLALGLVEGQGRTSVA